jgi:lipopolysaccharide/colanic/teichoic acid biosynthesis glycosyltransferase
VRKIREPFYPERPTYGPFIRLNRYGKKGKMIGVYKMRTMHAYSEYLQEYVYKKNELQEGGKFADDFRVTASGKFMRKFWLDELPMILNLLNGDMKLVGVRPLSKHYFNLYTEELREKRIKYRPGLVPPFYVDMPKTLEEIMDSESRYLDAYRKNPIGTDIKYFFLAFWNIIFKRARSN